MYVTQPTFGIMPNPDKWVVKTVGEYVSARVRFTLPVGFITDFASIPHLVQNIADVDGDSRLPATGHDLFYSGRWTTREFADAFLRDAMIEYGAGRAAAAVYWGAVRSCGWIYWNRRNATGKGLQRYDFIDDASYAAAKALPPPVVLLP